ncbi:hypothetical protein [Neptuniibacter sp. QD37_11]|uniref:hypothetical protein n=1 Tax=Neptuniibacter sp. QD37_11 TaxID=3398209 RepID=UPI0039F55CEB
MSLSSLPDNVDGLRNTPYDEPHWQAWIEDIYQRGWMSRMEFMVLSQKRLDDIDLELARRRKSQ